MENKKKIIIIVLTVFVGRPYASSIYSILCLIKESNALYE